MMTMTENLRSEGWIDESLVEPLAAARDLVAAGWTQGSYARSASGDPVAVSDPEAAEWCAIGACSAVTVLHDWTDGEGRDIQGGALAFELIGCLVDVLDDDFADLQPGAALVGYNDQPGTTQGDMVKAFERAITVQQAKP
jgi:hypothetical protein